MSLAVVASRNDVPTIEIDSDRLLADMRALADFGKVGSGVHRRALGSVDMQARGWLADRMRAAGLAVEMDGVGNVIGRTPHARRILIGSHTDTVPNGGWLDGAMGVIYGLELARAFMAAGGGGEIGLEIVSFSDEEGCFAALLGSHSFVGEMDRDAMLDRVNEDGVRLADTLEAVGLADKAAARFDPAIHPAYLEAHIEQGPVLEAKGLPIGIVTTIVGVRGWKISFHGQADHAGTTPMAMRLDAGAALCDFAVRIAAFCRRESGTHTVWNGGDIRLIPGAHNVVPERADYIFSFRDPSAALLDRIAQEVERLSSVVAAEHGVTSEAGQIFAMAPAAMDETLMGLMRDAAEAEGAPSLDMPSGAGHDAMVLARHVPTGMLFIPSIAGRSHHVAEDSAPEDIVTGARVMARALTTLCRTIALP